MKEATGEANMTIVTVVLIGIITLIATPIITNLVRSSSNRACCVNNGGLFRGGSCYLNPVYDENGNVSDVGEATAINQLNCNDNNNN